WPDTHAPPDLGNVSAIASGYSHNLALVTGNPRRLHTLITAPVVGTNGFSLTLPTKSGKVYALEYKNSLLDPNWSSLPLVIGSGAARTIVDPTVNASGRFY